MFDKKKSNYTFYEDEGAFSEDARLDPAELSPTTLERRNGTMCLTAKSHPSYVPSLKSQFSSCELFNIYATRLMTKT